MSEDAPVLLACDGSAIARLAVAAAARLFPSRPVVAVAVWSPAPAIRPGDAFGEYHGIPAPSREELDERLAHHIATDAERHGTAAGLRVSTLVLSSDDVAQTLADQAASIEAVAIVVGTNDHGLLDVLPLGRVTRRLADLADMPLVLLPGPSRAARDAEAGG